MSHAAISFENVTVTYDRCPALHHVSGRFEPGSLTAVVGPNGAGKSTLLKALMGELSLGQGRINRSGIDWKCLGYLPQAAETERNFPISVADTVSLGAWHKTGPFGAITRAIARQINEALLAVGLEGFGCRPIGALSSGQFQRVLFARLVLQDPQIIILDEPFTGIDVRTTRDLLALVARWHDEGRTVIAVLHDFNQVREHFPQTLLLARELIGWGPTETTLTAENLLRTRAMAENWDAGAKFCNQLPGDTA